MIMMMIMTMMDFQVKTIRVDDRNIAIQLWDTAGQAGRTRGSPHLA